MMIGAWITQAISVAAELGVADLLDGGAATAAELARELGVEEERLRRLLRALCSVGIFTLNDGERYELTPLGELLRSDVEGSQRAFARMAGAEFYGAWHGLHESVVSGIPGFDSRYGKSFFAYMTDNPERWSIYDRAMHGVHGPETLPMLDAYDFGRFSRVVDVGGGDGSTLAVMLQRYPHMQGTLYELPDVSARGEETFLSHGLAERAVAVGGDFFTEVPGGGDIYLLRHVIHDWDDEASTKILENCRKSMKSEGRVLLVESIIREGNDFGFVKWVDLMMMVIGGRERTVAEYARLMEGAGLRLERVIETACEVSILEGVAAA